MNTSVYRNHLLLALAACTLGAVVGCGGGSPSTAPRIDFAKVSTIREGLAADSTGDADAGQVVDLGSGWGTLKGTFVVEGAIPPLPQLTVNKDEAICAARPESLQSPAIMVGEGAVLRNVLLYARDAGRVHEDAASIPEEPAVFDQKDCIFLSHVFGVRVGRAVLIKNSDPIAHNTKIEGRISANSFNSNGQPRFRAVLSGEPGGKHADVGQLQHSPLG